MTDQIERGAERVNLKGASEGYIDSELRRLYLDHFSNGYELSSFVPRNAVSNVISGLEGFLGYDTFVGEEVFVMYDDGNEYVAVLRKKRK